MPGEPPRQPTRQPTRQPSRELVAVPNPHPGREYEVRCETPEFTCICPMTGQPDFAHVTIRYVPDRSIVELKSLKLYLWSYRQEGAFHEDVTNRILEDFVDAIGPRRVNVQTDWLVRGGIHTVVEASHP
jgi:7-cyano-7-deazaguanine reductase